MGTKRTSDQKFFFEVRDLNDELVSTGLCIKLITPTTGSAMTVYNDQYGTAHSYISSGCLSVNDFETLGGRVEFWSGESSANVLILNEQMEGMLAKNIRPNSPTRIIWNPGEVRKYVVDFFEDFLGDYVTGDKWTIATDSGGTITIPDGVDGYAQLLTGGTDEDGTTISSTAELFLFQTDKNLYFEARVRCAETDTTNYDANIAVGLSDTVTVDLMADDGAGPASSFDGALFFKKETNKYWEFMASNATSQDENSDMVAYTRNVWDELSFVYDYNDGVTASITPTVNGTAYDAVDLTISGLAEMHACATVKTTGTQTETFDIDYIRVTTERDWD